MSRLNKVDAIQQEFWDLCDKDDVDDKEVQEIRDKEIEELYNYCVEFYKPIAHNYVFAFGASFRILVGYREIQQP